MTIARGTQGSGKLTDRNIVDITTGSVQAATLFTEGGTKAYQVSMNEAIKQREKTLTGNPDNLSQEQLDKLKDNIKDSKNAIDVSKQYEEA
ncbi:hypothetical protein, partial [Pseudomonas viridiflava]|uniref:hypothetical protein n=1 Tax=Pseudomonas viridiflava TaxID=33069 RepID=UPI0013CE995A